MVPVRIAIFVLITYTNAFHVTHISDCGKARGCWRLPIGCQDSSDCTTMVTWKHERRHLIIEVESKVVKAGQWLGIGFSKDDKMGNDTVFECRFPATATDTGSVHLSHNVQTKNIMLEAASSILLRDGYAEMIDGKALCGGEWVLDNIHLDEQERKVMHVISSGRYRLLFAFGDMDKDQKKMHGMAGEKAPWKSKDDVRFCHSCSSAFTNLDLSPTSDFKQA